MKRVGIIGGIGPASTLDYYVGIIEGYRSKTGSNDYPEIIINSVNMTEVLSLVQNKDWKALEDLLLDAIDDLDNAGADFAAIASNTPHIVFDSIEKRSPMPLISIVEKTCRYAKEKECKRVVVIGTLFTMESGLYTNALGKYSIEAILPSDEEKRTIHDLFFPNLENGIVVPEDKQKILAIVGRLIAEQNADALILGCTELPLMIKEGDLDIMIINATEIHIEAIVDSIDGP